MYPTSVTLSTTLTVLAALSSLLTGHGVSAGPAIRRADSSSVSATTSATAVASSASGVSSSAADKSKAASTASSSVANTPSSTVASSQSTFTPPPKLSGNFPACHEATGPLAPFCLPNNGSVYNPGQTYYVTWDADAFPLNSTVTVELNYANASKGGANAYSSSQIRNSYGYTTIKMDKAWLQGEDSNNLTFYLVELNPAPNSKPNIVEGATIMLETPSPSHYPPTPKTNAPNHLGLVVGLPVTLGFCALVVLGLMIGMRRTRHIGLGNVMGRRNKGYGIGKSRRQRMRGGKNGAIQLNEHEIEPVLAADPLGDEFDDHNMPPRRPGHAQHDSLGSLVASPTVPDYSDNAAPRGQNAFRDELNRQQNRI
ncbi:MAG: hypothetical protein M1819_002200 [Sarea resinae]|nr:MAG: hypothetical protein M1819_002200 [Sarea resinae]